MTSSVQPGESTGPSQTRQAVMYCPYCAEETLFPREEGGWQVRAELPLAG